MTHTRRINKTDQLDFNKKTTTGGCSGLKEAADVYGC